MIMTMQDQQMNIEIQEQRKCYHFNKGYCKFKEKCDYYHPTIDCIDKCQVVTCKYRHRNVCTYGDNCYHHKKQKCEYLHDSNNLPEVTLACEDEDQNKAHKVILTAPSTNKDIENENAELKLEIEHLKMEIKDGKEREIAYKNEIDNNKEKNMYINIYKIENEKLKKEIDEIKENYVEKEAEHNNKIDDLRKRIKMVSLEKIYQSKNEDNKTEGQNNGKHMETETEIKVYNCKDCEFKTNWMNNLKTHKNKCKKTKKRNKS